MTSVASLAEALEMFRAARQQWENTGYERWIGVPMQREYRHLARLARQLTEAARAADLTTAAPYEYDGEAIEQAEELAQELAETVTA